MYKMNTVDDLWNHIAYVIAYAPGAFPHRDFIPQDQQMTLQRAFDQLREGIAIAYPEDDFYKKRQELNDILNIAYEAYVSGDEIKAGHLLNDFQDRIFKEK